METYTFTAILARKVAYGYYVKSSNSNVNGLICCEGMTLMELIEFCEYSNIRLLSDGETVAFTY